MRIPTGVREKMQETGFEIEERDGAVCIRFTRQQSFNEILDLLRRVADIEASRRRIWILNDDFNFSAKEIAQFARIGAELWPPPGRVAFVSAEPLGFGLMRMMEARRGEERYESAVFRTEQEAWAWMHEGEARNGDDSNQADS